MALLVALMTMMVIMGSLAQSDSAASGGNENVQPHSDGATADHQVQVIQNLINVTPRKMMNYRAIRGDNSCFGTCGGIFDYCDVHQCDCMVVSYAPVPQFLCVQKYGSA